MSYPTGAYNSAVNCPFHSGFPSGTSPFGSDTSYSATDTFGFPPPYQSFTPPIDNSYRPLAATTHMNNKALVSMLLGIISFVTFWPAIPAIIIGFMARKEIKRGKGTGKFMALIGVVCGMLGCVTSIAFWFILGLLLLPMVVLPFLMIVWYFLKA